MNLFDDPGFKKLNELFEGLNKLNENGTDQDTIPGGFGEFGHTATNPIPVNTVFGNIAYLAKLRTPEGKKSEYIRLGSTGEKNIEHPIDMYEIRCEGKRIAILYISPYHKKNSKKAPKGFTIAEHI